MGAEASGAGPAVEELVAAGVPLAQYAEIHAALAEEFPLEAVLRHEGLDPASWAAIDAAWAARMRESAAGDQRLLEAYDAHLASARDRLARPLPPLDEDLRAWLDFLRAWSTAPDPFEMLEERGLRSADLTRLQALWAKRMAADGSLREQALAVLDEPPGPCPAVTTSPQALPPPIAPRVAAAPQLRNEAPASRRPSLAVPLPGAAGSEPDALDAEPVTGGSPLPPRPPSPGVVPAAWATKIPVDFDVYQTLPPELGDEPRPSLPFVPAPLPSPESEAGAIPVDSGPVETLPPNRLVAQKALPFRPPSPAIIPGSEPDSPPSLAPTTAPEPPVLPQGPVLPFVAPHGSETPEAAPDPTSALTIAQYASLCAELAVFPRLSESIFQRHGLGSSLERPVIDRAWQERLRRHPEEYRTWQELYQSYVAFWNGEARRG